MFFFGFRHSGDATHASGRQGVREAEPDRRIGNLTTLDPLVRSGPRGFSCFYSWIRLEVVTKNGPAVQSPGRRLFLPGFP